MKIPFKMPETPAIVGGKPVRNRLLPLSGAAIDESDIQAVSKVLRAGKLSCGEVVQQFESVVADYVGARHAVAVSSGAAGLHIALMVSAIGHDEEVITSPLTHPATSNCILYQGGRHTFADIDPATYNIDASVVASKISDRTEALIPVHFAGNPCDLDALHVIARENNLVVIEDAAHALGGEYRGKKIGSLSDLTVFSFSSPQHCYTGEGGIVTTNSTELYEWMLVYRENGMVTDPGKMAKPEGPWKMEMQDRGYNYRMTEMQAALGISQLSRVEEFIKRRTYIAQKYDQALSKHSAVVLPKQNSLGRSTWHYYMFALRLENLKASRKDIFCALQAENIEVGVHYLPVFLHPYYLWIGHPDVCSLEASLCPNAEEMYYRLLTLPIYSAMTEQDVDDVIFSVCKVLDYFIL